MTDLDRQCLLNLAAMGEKEVTEVSQCDRCGDGPCRLDSEMDIVLREQANKKRRLSKRL